MTTTNSSKKQANIKILAILLVTAMFLIGGVIGAMAKEGPKTSVPFFSDTAYQDLIGLYTPEALSDCEIDSDGPNEIGTPGQKDLTKFCIDPLSINPLKISWNWDDATSTNTADACALFDTDDDGMVNFALCNQFYNGAQQSIGFPVLYTCTDAKPMNCSSAAQVVGTLNSTCSISNSADDPFDSSVPRGPGDYYPNDTTSTCDIYAADFGGLSATLLDVCSYPSASPSSSASDCVVLSVNNGNLEVIKDVEPDAPATNWVITVTGPTSFSDTLTGDDTTGNQVVGAGSYTIVETAGEGTSLADYDTTWSCTNNATDPATTTTGTGTTISSYSIAKADVVKCTFTNTLKTATLTLEKTVVNDNGGTATEANFQAYIGASPVHWDTPQTLMAGPYTVSESAYSGYTPSVWGGDCAADGSITLTPGQNATCRITNNDQPGTLIVNKVVINDDGGTKTAIDFGFTICPTGQVCTDLPVNFEADGSNSVTVNAGSYEVTESVVSGYTTTYNNCSGVVVTNGGTATCTIANDDIPATLTVIKVLTQDNGGSKTYQDFSFSVNGGAAVPFEIDGQNDLSVSAGTYSVTEPAVAGFTTTYNNCTNLVIPNGGNAICTITNNDIAPTLTVIKHVVNDNGGKNVAADFTITVTDNQTPNPSFPGAESPGTTVDLVAGKLFSVSETGPTGYTRSDSGTCSLANPVVGGQYTCTLTNNDQQAYITVVKVVTNDNGGSAKPDDFKLTLEGAPILSGVAVPVNPGTYTVGETPLSGYTFEGFSGNCDANGDVTVALGESKTCTLTNNDQPGTLIVIKHVVNDDGGTKVAADFTMNVTGTNVKPNASFPGAEAPGTTVTLNAGSYSVDEGAMSGYTKSIGANCSGTIANGEIKTCTITNNDQPGTLIVIKHVINDNGGTKVAADFTMNVTGTNVKPNASFPGAEAPGTTVTLNAGSYSVDEGAMSGYTKTIGANCSGTIANGETKTCTITNDDIAPKLTVIKYLNPNTDSGKFNLLIDGVVKASNVGHNGTTGAVVLNAGLHTVSETAGTGTSLVKYVTVIGGDCAANGTITLAIGENKNCTITNSLVEVDINKQIATSATGPWSDFLGDIFVGTNLYYQFVVQNTGAVALQNVVVTDPALGELLFSDPTHVFCTYATLAVGEVKTCGPFGPVSAQDTGAGIPYENTATVNGCAAEDPIKCDSDSDMAYYTGLYWAFTPGFWKTHAYDDPNQPPSVDKYAWGWTAYHTYDLLGNVFDPAYLQDKPRGSNKTFAQYTLLQALSLKGGAGVSGAKGNLLRAATAALLNASFHETLNTPDHPAAILGPNGELLGPNGMIYYPLSSQGVIDAVNAALASGDRDEMLDLAAKLDSYNNGIHQVNWNWPVP